MTDDERQIRELVEGWMAATKAGNLPSVLALMTDDVMFITPGRPPFGKKEFAAHSEQMRDMKMDGGCEVQEVEVFGNRAYVRNHIHITLTKQGEPPMRLSGYTLGILRKEADGHWRLARDANLVMPETGG
jgi:uncharacterized protein (TIGR02246 family)